MNISDENRWSAVISKLMVVMMMVQSDDGDEDGSAEMVAEK